MQKKLFKIFQIFMIAMLSLLIIFIFALNIMFLKEDASPSLFGYNVFMLSTTNMEPQIMSDSIIFASTEKAEMLENGNVVLCYIGESRTKAVMRIHSSEAIDGVTYYTVAEDNGSSVSLSVSKNDILARCVYSSSELGAFVIFAKSTKGLLFFIVLPCLLLIILQVLNIRRSHKEKQAIPIPVPDFDGLDELSLFDNRHYSNKDSKLEAKKQSLADNFKPKAEMLYVKPNAPAKPVAPAKPAAPPKPTTPAHRQTSASPASDGLSRIAELESSGRAKEISRSFDEVATKHVENELKSSPPPTLAVELNSHPKEIRRTHATAPIPTPIPAPAEAPKSVPVAEPQKSAVIKSSTVQLPPAVANVPVITPEQEEAFHTPIPERTTPLPVLPPAVANVPVLPPDTPEKAERVPEYSAVHPKADAEPPRAFVSPEPVREIPSSNDIAPEASAEKLEILQDADSELQRSKPATAAEHRRTVKRRPKRTANSDIEDLMKMIDDI